MSTLSPTDLDVPDPPSGMTIGRRRVAPNAAT
jgi:hypothetical protein